MGTREVVSTGLWLLSLNGRGGWRDGHKGSEASRRFAVSQGIVQAKSPSFIAPFRSGLGTPWRQREDLPICVGPSIPPSNLHNALSILDLSRT